MLLLIAVWGFASVVKIASSPEHCGPVIDKLRLKVVMYAWPPDAPLSKMLNGSTDVWTTLVSPANERDATMAAGDFLRESDIETLHDYGFTITSAPGYDVAYFCFNIRPDQSYKDWMGNPEAGPVLSDVNFRHALFHAYNQKELFAPCWTIKPVQSLVPPAQCDWVNPTVPTHPYNPGDPLIQPGQLGFDPHSSCGILWSAGYTYSSGDNNWVTPYDLNNDTILNDLIPEMRVVTPTYERAPTSAEHGARWCAECNAIGVPVWHDPREFWPYLANVFGDANFDICFVGINVDRFPDFLYDLCHSSQDCLVYPWRYNAPGLCDPELDSLAETVKYSLDHDAKVAACYEVQERLCNESYDYAFAYLPAYSKECFGAHQPGLLGIVNTEGHGSDNMWTYLNMHWEPGHPNERLEDGKTVVVWCLQDEPELLNPTSAGSTYAWTIMNPIFDPLIAVNPYTHEDVPWLAESWTLEEFTGTVTLDSENRYLGIQAGGTVEVTNGMNVTFNLNSTVEWHDGNPYTPSDAEFNLEFLRNNQIPRYTSMWQHVVDVQVINATAFVVVSNTTSQWLLYDYAGDAALLPPPVWAPLDGKPLNAILGYDPTANTTKPTGAGPRFGTETCPNQLYGTGPFIFDYYDPYAEYADMPANRYYFKSTAEIQSQLVEMFHKIGDVNRNGDVWGVEIVRWRWAFGHILGEPEYDPDADLNEDGIVDAVDGDLIGYNFGYKRTYPEPSGSASSSSDYTEQPSFSSKSLEAQQSSSPTETTIHVDPPTVIDDALQAGSYFPVNMNVADVSNLCTWQANMSWDPSIVGVDWHKSYTDEMDEYVGHGDGTKTVFHLQNVPVEENTETIYVFVTNESLCHGDDVTRTFWLDHTPAKEESETIYIPIIGESVGTGNGSTKVFTLDNAPVREDSETIYVDGVPQIQYLRYIINYTTGTITFNTPPGGGTTITADYGWLYGEKDVDYTIEYTTGNVTFTVPPPTSTNLTADYKWLNYTRNVDYIMNYTSGEVTFTVPPPTCTDIGADYTSWRPIYHLYEGDFLKGTPAAKWEPPDGGKPYSHAEQFTKTPTTHLTTAYGWNTDPPWYDITAAVSDGTDEIYAVTSTDGAEEIFGDFGFPTTIGNVSRVIVEVQAYTIEENSTEQDKIYIEVSNDGGASWGGIYSIPMSTDESPIWVDVTHYFDWTPNMLNDTNLKVKMKYKQVGDTANYTFVNYLSVNIAHSEVLIVDNPVRAYDNSADTYADFHYSDSDVGFTISNFGHNFPSGCWDPYGEYSEIVQVDLHLRYSANASALGDRYRIVYSVPPWTTDKVVLLDWTSSEAPLNTYVWTNITDPDTFFPEWDWHDISDLEIAVETDRVGGDPDAFFREYEAWIVVTYERPTAFACRINQDEGWCLFAGITRGRYPGVIGNGTLATLDFQVLEYGDSILNITYPQTKLFRLSCHPLIPQGIPHLAESGYFSNRIPGDICDTPGTPPDGDVDRYDFFAFATNYGKSTVSSSMLISGRSLILRPSWPS